MPSAVPVTGESYCGCDSQAESGFSPRLRGFHRAKDCRCGEEEQGGCADTPPLESPSYYPTLTLLAYYPNPSTLP